jgi:hypothetical protein
LEIEISLGFGTWDLGFRRSGALRFPHQRQNNYDQQDQSPSPAAKAAGNLKSQAPGNPTLGKIPKFVSTLFFED